MERGFAESITAYFVVLRYIGSKIFLKNQKIHFTFSL